MRADLATLALAVTLGAVVPAAADPRERVNPSVSRVRPNDPSSITAQRESEEAAARQAEFERRISERSNRAARSICAGCGPGTRPGAGVTPPGVRAEGREEAMPRDPAAAPLY